MVLVVVVATIKSTYSIQQSKVMWMKSPVNPCLMGRMGEAKMDVFEHWSVMGKGKDLTRVVKLVKWKNQTFLYTVGLP